MLEKIKSLFIPETFVLENGKEVKEKFNPTIYITIVLIILIYLCAKFTGFDFNVLIKRGKNFTDILFKMIPPNIDYLKNVIKPMIDTLTMSIIGTMIGGLLALPFSFLSAANIMKNKFILSFLRTILSLIRTIPVLIYALLFVYIFGVGTFAGTLAIALFTFSIATKMLYEQIETVDMGPYEAMSSSGANTVMCVRYAILPQVIVYYYSMLLYNFEMNVRSAAILGYVGAGGIGILLNETLGWRMYSELGMILVVLIIVVVLIESTSRYIRGRIS